MAEQKYYCYYSAFLIDHYDLLRLILINFPFNSIIYYYKLIFKEIAKMSIVDIINLNSLILGLSRDGYLLCWDISPLKLAEEDIK